MHALHASACSLVMCRARAHKFVVFLICHCRWAQVLQ
jgi:hypothetical protein